ncbi:MAG: S1/P1 Nuclease [Acidobacteria bacterium]|nr:MAG: S1/P1 Nuclease [Acidobacteriota bacterium]
MQYLSSGQGFAHLSLADLLRARDQFHPHLVHKHNVVGTAVGRYLIRSGDPRPDEPHAQTQSRPPRTLENSEIRDYSWPCVIAFVKEWVDDSEFGRIGELPASAYVPKTIYLDDGKAVPVCVVLAPRVMTPPLPLPDLPRYETKGLLQGGARVTATLQKVTRAATIGCLLSDGHKIYALTSRHVAGKPGEVLKSESGVTVGTTSELQIGRVPFESVYAPWPGRHVFVNLDVALVELENLRRWSTGIRQVGPIGPMAALSTYNLSLNIIGAPVRTFGAVSGLLEGRIAALFYRYKSVGGFDYVADFLIGSRTDEPLATRPGDSGAVWVLDVADDDTLNAPIAVQWGGTALGTHAMTFALASNLSTIARELDVDVYRGSDVAAFEYWGPVGHSAIGQYACSFIENENLKQLLEANFAAMGKLANVPDDHWKEETSTHKKNEGPNHYADMDYAPENGKSLDDLTQSEAGLDVQTWIDYYDQLGWTKTNERGLLPFRVWQCFNELVEYIRQKDIDRIVAAAGVLAHYPGDSCQPLHGSIYSQGDPFRDPAGNPVSMRGPFDPIYGGAKKGTPKLGVHSTYESVMVKAKVPQLEQGIEKILPATHGMPLVENGRAAAWQTIELMRRTRQRIDPLEMVDTYAESWERGTQTGQHDEVNDLWNKYGERTIATMIDGCKTLAMLWDSAWKAGNGDDIDVAELTERDEETLLTTICDDDERFFTSTGLDAVKDRLT